MVTCCVDVAGMKSGCTSRKNPFLSSLTFADFSVLFTPNVTDQVVDVFRLMKACEFPQVSINFSANTKTS